MEEEERTRNQCIDSTQYESIHSGFNLHQEIQKSTLERLGICESGGASTVDSPFLSENILFLNFIMLINVRLKLNIRIYNLWRSIRCFLLEKQLKELHCIVTTSFDLPISPFSAASQSKRD